MELTSSHNLPLVGFSIFIAVLASYTALELTERISVKETIKINWLIGSSLTMGTGIWSMHFVGMLAYSIRVPITYDLSTVVASWFPAVLASGIAFYYLHKGLTGVYLIWAGTLLGSGIGAMHYIGMAAMRVPAQMQWNHFAVCLSIIFAVILSSISLATANYVKGFLEREELKLGGSFLMGAAISGLHYIGMAGVKFILIESYPTSYLKPVYYLDLKTTSLAYTIGIVTVVIIGGAFVACIKAQKQDLQQMSQKLKKSARILTRVNQELEKRVDVRTVELKKAKYKTEEQNIELSKAKKALEKASESKNVFLTNIIQELRTPLNSILGCAKALQKDANLTKGQIKDLRTIRHSGTHLLTLINDILDLSKLNTVKLEIHPTSVQLKNLLLGVANITQMWANEKGISIKLYVDDSLPATVKADEKRLRQILINLLNNTVKFTSSEEIILKVVVLNEPQEHLLKKTHQKLRFSVSDTSIKMDLEQLSKLFKPFEQAGNLQSRTEDNGLGLALSKQLVRLMESELKLESKVGLGSTFWFDLILPVVKHPALIPVKERKIKGYKGKPRKILIVDDQEVNRDLLATILQPIGFEIRTANNGYEALLIASVERLDLILLDLFMPGKTGFSAGKELRQIPEVKNTPIIIVSASYITEEAQKYLNCEDYLCKPIDEQKLLCLVQKYLHLEWIYEKSLRIVI